MTTTELRELLAMATPGPWSYVHRGSGDAPLIVAAINALPALLEVADAAKAVVAIDADPDGSVDANGVAIDRLAAALAKLEAAK